MHDDDVRGKKHDEHAPPMPEDQKIQEPKDPDEAMHESMHGQEGSSDNASDVKKSSEEMRGPPDRDEMMHALMHDSDDIHKHAWDEQKPEGVQSPPDREHLMHNLIMHGDLEHGEHHEATNDGKGERSDAVPSPPTHGEHQGNAALDRGGEKSEGLPIPSKHEEHNDAAGGDFRIKNDAIHEGMPSPPNEEQLMHGLMMHGNLAHGEHHDKHDSEHVNTGQIGPLDAEEQLHGVLMHGDKDPGHHHDHGPDKTEQVPDGPKGPDYDSLHGLLMHGDTEPGHDHSAEDKNVEHEVFRDLSKIAELGLDEDILKIGNLQELLKRDKAEYAEYLAANPKSEDAANVGSTFATVPDTILSDMELMKQRYLSKLGDDIEALEMEAAIVDQRYKEKPFTADDINSVTGLGTAVHEHEDRNVHEMELIGSTEPINMRHKMFKVLQENKEKEERESEGKK